MSRKSTKEQFPSAELLAEMRDLVSAGPKKRRARSWEILLQARNNPDFPVLADFGLEHGLIRSCDDMHAAIRDGQSTVNINWINPTDGLEMVFIPGGSFLAGMRKTECHCDSFSMARYPVTNAQFRVFRDATGYNPGSSHPEPGDFLSHWKNGKIPKGKENHPVTWVSIFNAMAYCEWASLVLPTQRQWEKAGRGTDGRTYPWGEAKPVKKLFNYFGSGTTPVDKYERTRTAYGCEDMVGNVSEWCHPITKEHIQPLAKPETLLVLDISNPRHCAVRGSCYLRSTEITIPLHRSRSLAATRRNQWVGFRPAFIGPWCPGE